MSQFADIIVPLPLPRLFTYAIPEGAGLTAGKRVLVPLGRRKIYTGVVAQVHSEVPVDYKAREIIGVLDPTALIGEKQLDFWMWDSRLLRLLGRRSHGRCLAGRTQTGERNTCQVDFR